MHFQLGQEKPPLQKFAFKNSQEWQVTSVLTTLDLMHFAVITKS